jgi:signal transduction histidine kinase
MRQIEPRRFIWWRRSGLRWGAAVAAFLSCSFLIMFALMYWRSSALLFDSVDRTVVEQLELLSARPAEMLPFMITSRLNRPPPVITQVGLFAPDRKLIVGDVAEIPDELVLDGRAHDVRAPVLPDMHWRAAGRRLSNGRILIVARSADEILEVQAGLRQYAGLAIVPAILLSLAGGTIIGINSERRLRQINTIAERIMTGDLDERLPVRSRGDELDRLCEIFNRILARLQTGIDALTYVGENIAHDLRTPLTATRTRLERSLSLAGSGTPLGMILDQSLTGIDQTLSIVTALLRISDIQHGNRAKAFQCFDLGEIIQETAESYQPLAEDKGVALDVSVDTSATISGDRQLIVEALVNLLDNAIKFTPPCGRVSISLTGQTSQPVLTVSDTGVGIPSEQRQAIFNRFHRLDESRTTPGTGLGLSLVAAIVELHRFKLTLEDNHPGCRMTISCWPDCDGAFED